MTTSRMCSKPLSDGAGPRRVLVALGYSSPGMKASSNPENRRKRLADRGPTPVIFSTRWTSPL